MFLCEMALEMGMSIAELVHGRGTPMGAHELCVIWPCYFEVKNREAKREADRAEQEAQHRSTRTLGGGA